MALPAWCLCSLSIEIEFTVVDVPETSLAASCFKNLNCLLNNTRILVMLNARLSRRQLAPPRVTTVGTLPSSRAGVSGNSSLAASSIADSATPDNHSSPDFFANFIANLEEALLKAPVTDNSSIYTPPDVLLKPRASMHVSLDFAGCLDSAALGTTLHNCVTSPVAVDLPFLAMLNNQPFLSLLHMGGLVELNNLTDAGGSHFIFFVAHPLPVQLTDVVLVAFPASAIHTSAKIITATQTSRRRSFPRSVDQPFYPPGKKGPATNWPRLCPCPYEWLRSVLADTPLLPDVAPTLVSAPPASIFHAWCSAASTATTGPPPSNISAMAITPAKTWTFHELQTSTDQPLTTWLEDHLNTYLSLDDRNVPAPMAEIFMAPGAMPVTQNTEEAALAPQTTEEAALAPQTTEEAALAPLFPAALAVPAALAPPAALAVPAVLAPHAALAFPAQLLNNVLQQAALEPADEAVQQADHSAPPLLNVRPAPTTADRALATNLEGLQLVRHVAPQYGLRPTTTPQRDFLNPTRRNPETPTESHSVIVVRNDTLYQQPPNPTPLASSTMAIIAQLTELVAAQTAASAQATSFFLQSATNQHAAPAPARPGRLTDVVEAMLLGFAQLPYAAADSLPGIWAQVAAADSVSDKRACFVAHVQSLTVANPRFSPFYTHRDLGNCVLKPSDNLAPRMDDAHHPHIGLSILAFSTRTLQAISDDINQASVYDDSTVITTADARATRKQAPPPPSSIAEATNMIDLFRDFLVSLFTTRCLLVQPLQQLSQLLCSQEQHFIHLPDFQFTFGAQICQLITRACVDYFGTMSRPVDIELEVFPTLSKSLTILHDSLDMRQILSPLGFYPCFRRPVAASARPATPSQRGATEPVPSGRAVQPRPVFHHFENWDPKLRHIVDTFVKDHPRAHLPGLNLILEKSGAGRPDKFLQTHSLPVGSCARFLFYGECRTPNCPLLHATQPVADSVVTAIAHVLETGFRAYLTNPPARDASNLRRGRGASDSLPSGKRSRYQS